MAITNADLDRLMDDIRIRLPGALDNAIRFELFNVMDEFLKGSRIWRENISVVTKDAVTEYTLTPEGYSLIDSLLALVDADDVPVQATMSVPGALKLINKPTAGQTLTATVSLTVTFPTSREGYPQFPDWILSKYRTGILDGVLGRMMSQPAKPFSDSPRALFHGRRFVNTISGARADAAQQNLHGGQAWRFPPFA